LKAENKSLLENNPNFQQNDQEEDRDDLISRVKELEAENAQLTEQIKQKEKRDIPLGLQNPEERLELEYKFGEMEKDLAKLKKQLEQYKKMEYKFGEKEKELGKLKKQLKQYEKNDVKEGNVIQEETMEEEHKEMAAEVGDFQKNYSKMDKIKAVVAAVLLLLLLWAFLTFVCTPVLDYLIAFD